MNLQTAAGLIGMAIALIGCIIPTIDLGFIISVSSRGGIPIPPSKTAEIAGYVLIVVGVVTFFVAAFFL